MYYLLMFLLIPNIAFAQGYPDLYEEKFDEIVEFYKNKPKTENLVESYENWHEVQLYMFKAGDHRKTKVKNYIGKIAPSSPVNNDYVLDCAFGEIDKYGIPYELVFAIMHKESHFGTTGRAVRTMNPSNVGNTANSSWPQSSWCEGVKLSVGHLNKRKEAGVCMTPRGVNTGRSCEGIKVFGVYASPSGTYSYKYDTWSHNVEKFIQNIIN